MTSEVVALLNSWFGMRHVFSLVNRHESNGVEGSNKQILRHIRVLVHEERMEKRWSHPTILPLIKFILNDSVNSETGLRPFDAKFGSEQGTYLRLPECADSAVVANTWLRNLNADLSILRDISKRHQDELIKERTANNPPLESYNKYQPGDFVLYMVPTDKPKPTKLTSPFLGPYKVIRHEKNDVEAQHVVMGTIRVFHVTSLKLFMGTPAEAQELAQRDADQHMILNIRAYIGDPKRRTTCEFEVEFIDGSILWLPWSTDLFDTLQYEQFCRENMELYPLLFTTSEANNHIKMIRSQNIIMVQPGVEVYLKLRNICPYWYDELSDAKELEDAYHLTYVVLLRYTRWPTANSTKYITGYIPIFNHTCAKLDNYFITFYGQTRELTTSMVLVDTDFMQQHPNVKPSTALLANLPKKP